MPKLVSDTCCILYDTRLKFQCAAVVLDRHHWMLYYLVTAMYPRFLITLNENLENLPVTVRVGQVSRLLFPSRFGMVLIASMRPLTWSDKLANLARSLVSRRTRRRCGWARQRERSWRRKNISHMHMSSKGSSSCKRILGTRRRMQCNCSFLVHVVLWKLGIIDSPYLEMILEEISRRRLPASYTTDSPVRRDDDFLRLLTLPMASALHPQSTRDGAEHH